MDIGILALSILLDDKFIQKLTHLCILYSMKTKMLIKYLLKFTINSVYEKFTF